MYNTPLVTVYILVYKDISKIKKAIESIVSQTYPRIELFVSDDGSPNISIKEIEEVIQPYKERFENIVINKNDDNLGTVKHLNRIYQMFSGRIICGVAADDMYHDEHVVENVVKYFLDNPSKLVVTSRRLDETDNLIRPTKKLQNILERQQGKYKKIMLRATPLICGAGTFYRCDLFEKHGYFPEEFKLVEDASYYSKLVDMGVEFGFLDCITYVHAAGGVSDKSTKPHPWWLQDRKYLYETWLMDIAEKEDWFSKRCVKFHVKRVEKEGTIALIPLCMAYIDVCIYLLCFYKEEILEIIIKKVMRKK